MTAPLLAPCLTTQTTGDNTVARFRGDSLCLDETTTPPVADALSSLADRVGGGKLLLHLGNVSYMSSAGLGAIIALHKKVQAAGGTLVLCDLQPAVRELFVITRLHTLVNIDSQAP